MSVNATGLEGPKKLIKDMNPSWPTDNGHISQGDDHIRDLKTTLKAQFPYHTGPCLESSQDILDIKWGLEVVTPVEDDNSTGRVYYNVNHLNATEDDGSYYLPDGETKMYYSTLFYGGELNIDGDLSVGLGSCRCLDVICKGGVTGLYDFGVEDPDPEPTLNQTKRSFWQKLEDYHEILEELESEIALLESKVLVLSSKAGG